MSDLEQKNQSETEIETENGAPAEAQAPAAKPTLFQRYKVHMKKWWWVYVIVVCCIVLVVVLPIVYVGVPRFASKYINDYEYDYTGLKITNPTPDSFHVHQLQDLKVSGPFSSASGHLSAFNAAVYSLLDSNADSGANNDLLSNFPIPDIAFGGGKGFTIDQDLNISCVDCLSRVAAAAASDQEIKMLIKGDSNLKVGALPNAHLNIHKILTMQGYNVKEFLNTKGSFNVTGIDLMKEKNDQGYNVNATVSFKNPSPFIVEMGTATFNLSISGTPAGNVTVPNLFLNEGITETYILGDIDENQLIHGGIGGSDSGSSLGDVTIDLQGDRVVYQGVEIPYFTAAIRAVQAPVKVNLLDYMSDIL